MFRGYTYRLKPTGEQSEKFEQYSGVCRLIWNICLEQRERHWRQYQATTGDNLNWVTQSRQLKDLRKEFDWIKAVPQIAQSRVIRELDAAYVNFFRGRSKYPNFKKKNDGEGFSFPARDVKIERVNKRWSRIHFPKLGWVKYRRCREIEGTIREVSITKIASGWQLSVGCLIQHEGAGNGKSVGMDRGIAVPVMLSDGTAYTLPDSIAALEKRYKTAQRAVSRGKRGSMRHAKAIRRASQIKAKQARIRKHWAHETTTEITRNYGTVVIERLRTANMTKKAKLKGVAQKRGLNRAILNVGWFQIEKMLAYKAAKLTKVDPAYTSQTCSECGTIYANARKSQALYSCGTCGHEANADLNAAINILKRGNTPCVEEAGYGPDEAQTGLLAILV